MPLPWARMAGVGVAGIRRLWGLKAVEHLMLGSKEPFESEMRGQGTDLALCHGTHAREPGEEEKQNAWEVLDGPDHPRVVLDVPDLPRQRRSWMAQIPRGGRERSRSPRGRGPERP